MSEPRGRDCGAYRLVLLRHGQSEWNARNLFTGWANPDLTAAGEREAVCAGHGIPLVYQLGPDMRPVATARYLDPDSARTRATRAG